MVVTVDSFDCTCLLHLGLIILPPIAKKRKKKLKLCLSRNYDFAFTILLKNWAVLSSIPLELRRVKLGSSTTAMALLKRRQQQQACIDMRNVG